MSTEGADKLNLDANSHQELPYLIHATTNVPYFLGRRAHTIISVNLKKFAWIVKLVERDNEKYILASKDKEKWLIQVVKLDMTLSEALHSVKERMSNELQTMAEEYQALAVLALVADDSATLISLKTYTSLSPDAE